MEEIKIKSLKKIILPIRGKLYGRMIERKVTLDFSIIGFPKCATTSIHKTLEELTDIYMPSYEIQISSLMKGNVIFPENKRNVGIKNPNIIFEPHNLLALYNSNKNMKFIISMRKPSDWLFSFYQYRMLEIKNNKPWLDLYLKRNPEYKKITFDDVVYRNREFLGVSRKAGFFVDYLIDIFEWIPKENILVMMMEEISMNPDDAYSRLFDFLGVNSNSSKFLGVLANNKSNFYEHRNKYSEQLLFLDDFYEKKNKELNVFLSKNIGYNNVFW